MFRVAVFACAVAFVYGCCFPAQWHGGQSVLYITTKTGSPEPPVVTRSVQLIDSDSNAKMVAVLGNSTTNGINSQYKVILDYQKGIQYTASGNNCKKEAVSKEDNPFCIPASAKMVSRGVLGVGSNSLNVTTYQYPYGGQSLEIVVTDTCVPVSETVTSEQNGTYTLMNVGIANIKPGLSSATAFDLPPACRSDPGVVNNVIFGR